MASKPPRLLHCAGDAGHLSVAIIFRFHLRPAVIQHQVPNALQKYGPLAFLQKYGPLAFWFLQKYGPLAFCSFRGHRALHCQLELRFEHARADVVDDGEGLVPAGVWRPRNRDDRGQICMKLGTDSVNV
eukprot:1055200-Prymnesium_polylepis.1